MSFDLLIRNVTVVTGRDVRADHALAAVDGRIVAIARDLSGPATTEIDGSGLHLMPGLIDAHVHFNEPGRTDWEGIASGSAALAAGGGTCFFDMPLNSSPPLLDAAGFAAKHDAARQSAMVDYGLWGGLTPRNLSTLDDLASCGIVGFKAFMCDSGLEEFPEIDDASLLAGMRTAARWGVTVAVHAESAALTSSLTRSALARGGNAARDFLESRPMAAEIDAIERSIQLAQETRCSLHIVHVSGGSGVARVAEARARGIDVTCETCPHYLFLTDADLERIGAAAKCAPPLRTRDEQDELWRHMLAGNVEFVASDHSPAPPGMKVGGDFFRIWGGIAGCQTTLPLLITQGRERGLTLPQLAALVSEHVARRFRLRGKGGLTVGSDADFALVDLFAGRPIASHNLLYRHALSPFIGRPIHGIVRRTFVRGIEVVRDCRVVSQPIGRLVRPASLEYSSSAAESP